jgi:hypothetical protein
MLLPILKKPSQVNRSCGECTVCCDKMGVPELGKPYDARCPSLTNTGCGCYETKPDSCSAYKCFWLRGYGEEKDRPDKSGILISPEETGVYVYLIEPPNDIKYTIQKIVGKLKKITTIKPTICLWGQMHKVNYPIDSKYAETVLVEPYTMQDGEDYFLSGGPWRESLLFPDGVPVGIRQA